MECNCIVLDPGRLNFPLPPCAVGKLSSAVFMIDRVPDDIKSLGVVIEYKDGDKTERYNAAACRQADGSWRAYLLPAYFPGCDDGLKYHIVGVDARENPRWLGAGDLRVFDNPADGGGTPSVLPHGSYAYNPVTGLYHKLVAEVNDCGEISVSVEQEGVEL